MRFGCVPGERLDGVSLHLGLSELGESDEKIGAEENPESEGYADPESLFFDLKGHIEGA